MKNIPLTEADEVDEIFRGIMNDDNDDLPTTTNTQWGVSGGNLFYPLSKTIPSLKPGYYGLVQDRTVGACFTYRPVLTEKLMLFPNSVVDDIINDITTFWKKKGNYDKYEIVYKRGILLYGYPGNGKTSVIELLSKKLIEEHNGIVIKINGGYELEILFNLMPSLRNIEKNRKLIIVFEDVDGLIVDEGYERMLINFLDGAYKIDNVVNIATTNYPEKLKERVTNRPSRFDRRYLIDLPDKNVREYYIKKMVKEDDLKQLEIEKWINDTEGFTLDHLKELIISVYVLNYDYSESLKTINEVRNNLKFKIEKYNNKKLGFQ